MPSPRAPHVPRQRVADEDGRGGSDGEGVERASKIRGSGFVEADARGVHDDARVRPDAGLVADCLEVAVEVGHDAEAVAPGQIGQQAAAVPQARARVLDEAIGQPQGEAIVEDHARAPR